MRSASVLILSMLTLAQQQELCFQIGNYFYLDSRQAQPPCLLSSLLTSGQPIHQLQYLSEPLAKSSHIRNKSKLNRLVKCMVGVCERVDELLEGINSLEEAEKGDMMAKVLRLPGQIMNLESVAGGIVRKVYAAVMGVLNRCDTQVRKVVLETMVLLGHTDMIVKQKNIREVVAQTIGKITRGYRILLETLKQCPEAFEQFAVGFQEQDFVKALLNHILFDQTLKPSRANTVFSHLLKLSHQNFDLIFKKILFDWSNRMFPQIRSPNSQKFLSNLLAMMLTKADINREDVTMAINRGIHARFEYFKEDEFVCQSAVVVWKAYAIALKIQGDMFDLKELEKMYNIDRFEDGQDKNKETVNQIEEEVKEVKQQKEAVLQEKKELNYSQLEQQEEGKEQPSLFDLRIGRPKNLYDCYLGLLSDSSERKSICLKSVSSLVRTHSSDLVFVWRNLTTVLLALKDEPNQIQNFQTLKRRALVALIIYRPEDVVSCMSEYFYKDCGLADRIQVISTLAEAIKELGDNPEKYKVEGEGKEQDAFYFKKVESKYTKPERSLAVKQKEAERAQRIDQKSRRWGHTKKIYQLRQTRNPSELLPMRRDDLLLPQTSSPYFNRLYMIINNIFFKFVLPLHNHKKLLNDNLFASCLIQLLTEFANNITNYHEKYKIIDEMLDLHELVTIKDINVQRSKLGLMLKISSAVDSNLPKYPLVLDKVIKIMDKYRKDNIEWFDPSMKLIVSLITENFRKALQLM